MSEEVVVPEVPVVPQVSVFAMKFEDGCLAVTIDSNKDGEPVVELKLYLSEAVQEAIAAFASSKK